MRREARRRREDLVQYVADKKAAMIAPQYLREIYSTCAVSPSDTNRQFERAVADGVFTRGMLVFQVKICDRWDAEQVQVYRFPGFYAIIGFALGSGHDYSYKDICEIVEACRCANCVERRALYARAKAAADAAELAEYARLGATPGSEVFACSLHPPPVAVPIAGYIGCFDCDWTGHGPDKMPCGTCKGTVVPASTRYDSAECDVCEAAFAAGRAARDAVYRAAARKTKVPAGTRPIEIAAGVCAYPVGLGIGFVPEPLEVCARLCPMHPAVRRRIMDSAKQTTVTTSLDCVVDVLSSMAPLYL